VEIDTSWKYFKFESSQKDQINALLVADSSKAYNKHKALSGVNILSA